MSVERAKKISSEDKINANTLLRKIHFKRLKKENITNEECDFLHDQYIKNNDVRYFNELLWLDNKNKKKAIIKHFNKNLDEKKRHKYFYTEKLKSCLKIISNDSIANESDFNGKKICLIGLPFHFIIAFRKLRILKADVEIVNIAYHPSSKMKLLVNNKMSKAFYKLYFGKSRYSEITIKNKAELKDIKLTKVYDIGFHKLSFIISDNLINQFKQGLINDHWGALPLFKGRSTLDYSKLFGAELIISNHLIHKEIDAGPILLYSKIDRNNIKKSIYYDFADRVVKSIVLLSKNKFKDIDNLKGELFYEMHPFLKKHIKTHKL